MPDFTLTVTDAQLKALRQLDPVKTARQVLQIHVDTWLAPLIQEADVAERKAVAQAYMAATPAVRDQIKTVLGVG